MGNNAGPVLEITTGASPALWSCARCTICCHPRHDIAVACSVSDSAQKRRL